MTCVPYCSVCFNDTATTEIYTLSLHDALPILVRKLVREHGIDLRNVRGTGSGGRVRRQDVLAYLDQRGDQAEADRKSHTSELQSRQYLVCRLLLDKKTSSTWIFTPS